MSDKKESIYLQNTSNSTHKIDNVESRKILDKVVGELKPEDKISIDSKSKQDEGTDKKESGKIDEIELNPEDEISSDKTYEEENEIDNTEFGKIDEIELNPEDEISSDKTYEEENEIDNTEFGKIDEIELNPEDEISSDKTSEEENGIDNKEFDKTDEIELNPEDEISSDKKPEEENGTDHKESCKIDSVLKPEDKISIINNSRIENGPPPALKIINLEFGESSAKLSIKNEMWIDNEEFAGSSAKHSLEDEMCIDNEEYIKNLGNNKILLEDKTYINYNKSDLDDRLPPTTIDEKHAGEMRLSNFSTLAKPVNSKKRYQNQNEGLNDNELYLLKKIKVEDNSNHEFDELWHYLEYDGSADFYQWVNILNLVDEQNIEVNARMAYSKFLELYPLCYGYWKRYANFEKINNNIQEFEKVLEDGLSAIPISVDLWIYYMTYLRMERYNEVDFLRNEFERSLKSCGLDYHSDQLWLDYISWEVEQNEIFNATNIYNRLICIPTLNYEQNFLKFQSLLFKYSPDQYLGIDEFYKRQEIIFQTLDRNQKIESLNTTSRPPGENFQPEITNDQILSLLIVEIIQDYRHQYEANITACESRKIYERNIERHFFHVQEVESEQIINWQNYIKFEKKAGNYERIIHLFERCLIPCVSHIQLWLNYIEYLSFVNFDVTHLLSDVFKRALFHHPKSLKLNLKYFDFSEAQGWTETAAETITQLECWYSNSKEVAIRVIDLARKKNDDSVVKLYKHYLGISKSKDFSSLIAVRYARFVWKHDFQPNLALKIIMDTTQINNIRVKDSLEIYLTLVELKIELNPKDHSSIIKTIDEIILQCNLYKDKLVFSKKKLQYAEDYIQDYDILLKAKNEYKNFKNASFRVRRQSSNNTM